MKPYLYLGDIEIPMLVGPAEEGKTEGRRFEKLQPSYGPPIIQDAGDEADTYHLDFKIHAKDTDPQAFYERLSTAKKNAEVLPLVYVNGEYHGDWVIENLSRFNIKTAGNRTWICVDISVDLAPAAEGSIVITENNSDKGDAVTAHDSAALSGEADADFDNTSRW